MRGNWYDYEPSTPIPVKGGIKLDQRQQASANWWTGRWLQALTRSGMGARLTRGKRYATTGQVFSLQIEPGRISASVQGSRRAPYRVSITAPIIPENKSPHMLAWFASQVSLGAQLLLGTLPQNLEQLFTEAGVWLFPPGFQVFNADCSCPDWANPCKHVAAVFMLLAQEFDRDPLLLLRFRGFAREDIMAGLGLGPKVAEPKDNAPQIAMGDIVADVQSFWSGKTIHTIAPGQPESTGTTEAHACLKQVGQFPLWRGEKPLVIALKPVYEAAVRMEYKPMQ